MLIMTRRNTLALLLVLSFIVLSVVGNYFLVRTYWQGTLSFWWYGTVQNAYVPTPATVTKYNASYHSESGGKYKMSWQGYRAWVSYAYHVGDVDLQGRAVVQAFKNGKEEEALKYLIVNYPIGMSMTVYRHPKWPEHSLLSLDDLPSTFQACFTGGIVLLGLFVGAAVSGFSLYALYVKFLQTKHVA